MRSDHRARPKAFAAAVLVCVALLALLAVIQVAHVHSVDTDADHCPLCIVLHTAAPVAAVAAAIVLVQLEAVTPVAALRAAGTIWQRQLFVRPPPSLSAASF
jgi:amino acid transporter